MKDFTKDIGKEDSSVLNDLFIKVKNLFKKNNKPTISEANNALIPEMHFHTLRYGKNTITGNISDLPKNLHYINIFDKKYEASGSHTEET